MTAQTAAKQPRYAEILTTLRSEIAAGTLQVGDALPTEAALCVRFGVSRFTVREALRRLQADGMVERVQGAGTRILRDAPATVFVQNYRSVSELSQYAAETRLNLLKAEPTQLDVDLAERIGGDVGETWLLLRGQRETVDGEVIAFVESFVPKRFVDLAPDLARGGGPIYAGLAEADGAAVDRVVQETQALPAPYNVAAALDIPPGAPVLRLLRRYFNANGPLIASFNWHHGGDRYVQRMDIDPGLG